MTVFSDIYRGRTVVVTGHTGFKGSWLTAWLLKLGARVVGIADAVPFLVIHALLQTKTTQLIESLESVSIKFLTALTSRQRTVLQGPVELPRAVA